MKKFFKSFLLASIGALTAILLLFIHQNTYRIIEKRIEINTPNGTLTAILALPPNFSEKLGLVVFVHGDGKINATYDDGYKPLWEKLASAGYASLSWNKPGINGSHGNWLDQSMEDRAQEVINVINWAKYLPEIDSNRIGLWGSSQAGWVIPKVVKENKSIAFSILVAPAINWISQGQYNTRKNLENEGYSEKEIKEVQKYDNQVLDLLKSKSTYEKYLEIVNKNKSVSKDRWNFIKRNYQSDATEDLKHFNSPVHLVLGGQDINVDVDNTEFIYRQNVQSNLLSVSFLPNANHSMIKKKIAASKLLTNLTAIFFPRYLFDDKYLNDLTQFVSEIDKNLARVSLSPLATPSNFR